MNVGGTPFAGRRLELGDLSGEVLGVGGTAGAAVEHVLIPHQNFASEKRNRISAPALRYA
jgi:hypothetical protein